jgi:phosphoenolpyruvate carboxykinase (GTP)
MARHKPLADWVNQVAALCQPDKVWWCDGSPDEYQRMLRLMVQGGTAIPLDPARPNSI